MIENPPNGIDMALACILSINQNIIQVDNCRETKAKTANKHLTMLP